MQKIGLVTITYNSAHVMEPFMQCVLNQTHTNFILYIIDNISSDNTLELLKNYRDERIVLIANKENVGVAKGNNQGIVQAMQDGCDELLIINNDVEFEDTLLEKLSRQLVELDLQPSSTQDDVLSRNESDLVGRHKIQGKRRLYDAPHRYTTGR